MASPLDLLDAELQADCVPSSQLRMKSLTVCANIQPPEWCKQNEWKYLLVTDVARQYLSAPVIPLETCTQHFCLEVNTMLYRTLVLVLVLGIGITQRPVLLGIGWFSWYCPNPGTHLQTPHSFRCR